MKKPRNATQNRERAEKWEIWRTRTADRSGRIPVTLIDASSVANAATGLRKMAAAIHARRPCYAQTLQRYAEQIQNGYTEAGAIAAMTTTPTANTTADEITQAEITLAEITLSENTLTEPGA